MERLLEPLEKYFYSFSYFTFLSIFKCSFASLTSSFATFLPPLMLKKSFSSSRARVQIRPVFMFTQHTI
jgi:hypothetical protein